MFAEDANHTLWTSGGGQVVGWLTLSDISRRLLLETGTIRDALGELSASGQDV